MALKAMISCLVKVEMIFLMVVQEVMRYTVEMELMRSKMNQAILTKYMVVLAAIT
jgi:hypothetical protein